MEAAEEQNANHDIGVCPHCGANLASIAVCYKSIEEKLGSVVIVEGEKRITPKPFPYEQRKELPFIHGMRCGRCGGSLEKVIRNCQLYKLTKDPEPDDDPESPPFCPDYGESGE